jgi:hypothetical protein
MNLKPGKLKADVIQSFRAGEFLGDILHLQNGVSIVTPRIEYYEQIIQE